MTDFLTRWRDGLSKTRKTTFGRIASFLGATEIDEDTWENLEGMLIQADMGLETAGSVIESLKAFVRTRGLTRSNELMEALRAELRVRLDAAPVIRWSEKPSVVLVVGVNGSGKTT